MTREDTRRNRARELAMGLEGGRTEFARMVGMTSSQVSQIIGKTPVKNIGNSIARRIEVAFDKPTGWLDAEPNSAPVALANVLHLAAEPDMRIDPSQMREWVDIFVSADASLRTLLVSAAAGLVEGRKSDPARNEQK